MLYEVVEPMSCIKWVWYGYVLNFTTKKWQYDLVITIICFCCHQHFSLLTLVTLLSNGQSVQTLNSAHVFLEDWASSFASSNEKLYIFYSQTSLEGSSFPPPQNPAWHLKIPIRNHHFGGSKKCLRFADILSFNWVDSLCIFVAQFWGATGDGLRKRAAGSSAISGDRATNDRALGNSRVPTVPWSWM